MLERQAVDNRSAFILGVDAEAEVEDAIVTGLTSVHVNRTLKLLETEGLIERLSPRSIGIGDWKKLADVGDFDSNYLHLHEGEPALA